MFGLTALELARIQFAFTMSSHIIFPATTIGLASYLAVLEGLWLWKKDATYRDVYYCWSHIFAVNFAMGVVSGIVMAYQFGTHWSYYSAFAGPITGPLLSYEVLTAFSLEAAFLGVALSGAALRRLCINAIHSRRICQKNKLEFRGKYRRPDNIDCQHEIVRARRGRRPPTQGQASTTPNRQFSGVQPCFRDEICWPRQPWARQ